MKDHEPTLDELEKEVDLLLSTVHEMFDKIQSLMAENSLLKTKLEELENE